MKPFGLIFANSAKLRSLWPMPCGETIENRCSRFQRTGFAGGTSAILPQAVNAIFIFLSHLCRMKLLSRSRDRGWAFPARASPGRAAL
jgi:hypothetical protein